MAQIIQGPWKPFSTEGVTKIATGTWECTIIRLRPRRRYPSEATLPKLLEELPRQDKAAAPAS